MSMCECRGKEAIQTIVDDSDDDLEKRYTLIQSIKREFDSDPVIMRGLEMGKLLPGPMKLDLFDKVMDLVVSHKLVINCLVSEYAKLVAIETNRNELIRNHLEVER